MPLKLLRVFYKEMEKISASESLTRIESFAVGSGSMNQKESSKIIRRLQRKLEGESDRPTPRPSTAVLTAIGIDVEIVKKGKGD